MSHPPSISVSGGSVRSESSTIVYDHEPFDDFSKRVYKLCKLSWPTACHQKTAVDRMKGGGFNRIIGLSIVHSERTQPSHYILRIPRFEFARLDRDVASLTFVRHHSKIPVPEVISFDRTSDNVLQSPYMIQTRLLGDTLQNVYLGLDREGQRNIARELGEVFAELQNLRSKTVGVLGLPSAESRPFPSVIIEGFDDTGPWEPSQYKDALPTQSTRDTLTAILQSRKNAHKEDIVNSEYMDSFITVVSEMDACGYLNDNQISLCHLDLAPRNILVDAQLGKSPRITGVLDWDSAVFAPRFMSCAPPMWIWAWNNEDDEDERLANETPATPELHEMKRIFEKAAGPTYLRLAYEPQYRLARTLCRLTIHGLRSNEDAKEADSLIQEWAGIKLQADGPKRGVAERTKRLISMVVNFFVRAFRSS